MTNALSSLILLLVTLFSGSLALHHHFFNQKSNDTPQNSTKKSETWLKTIRSMFPVFFIQLCILSFLYAPFKIPSGSMLPTLQVGDYILVNKSCYHLRFPYFNFKIMNTNKPKRGDIVVFSSTDHFAKLNDNLHEDMVKRVVGLPGDTIVYADKMLYINDELMSHYLIDKNIDTQYEPALQGMYPYTIDQQTLGKHVFQIKHYPITESITGTWVVPDKMYFVLGDNRDLSDDGRYWGFVPEDNLIGKVSYVWLNWPHFFKSWPTFKMNRKIE
ncbi:MAG: signal peptidase I [Endozoicomonadaceae bacterium]|nr:signal peptidase I [Endozoicomonadaceae bacterium]